MEKYVGYGNLKVYDLFVILLIAVLTILVAFVNGAFQLNLNAWVITIFVVGIELAYIFGVVNKRKK